MALSKSGPAAELNADCTLPDEQKCDVWVVLEFNELGASFTSTAAFDIKLSYNLGEEPVVLSRTIGIASGSAQPGVDAGTDVYLATAFRALPNTAYSIEIAANEVENSNVTISTGAWWPVETDWLNIGQSCDAVTDCPGYTSCENGTCTRFCLEDDQCPTEYGSTCIPLVGPTANEKVCSAPLRCALSEFTCAASEFADAKCIPAKEVCDGVAYDCALNEDEKDCG